MTNHIRIIDTLDEALNTVVTMGALAEVLSERRMMNALALLAADAERRIETAKVLIKEA